MPTRISPLSDVHPRAQLGTNVEIGPFCHIGPDVRLGDDCVVDGNVVLAGHTTIGERNRFWPGAVIGTEPQDKSHSSDDARLEIGNDNIFREGVTVNCGADKEDRTTRIGNGNMLMANSHVAHNCRLYDNTILVNGVLLGGHVHVQDGAIISGNTVVHHFSTIGTLAFVSGGCRIPNDIPPYMLFGGTENPSLKSINVVGMRRAGIDEHTIRMIRKAHRLLYREQKRPEEARQIFEADLGGVFPLELTVLFHFLEQQSRGKMKRAREVVRDAPAHQAQPHQQQRKAA